MYQSLSRTCCVFLLCVLSTTTLSADTITMDVPGLEGTFIHGQEPVEVFVDFGTYFQPLHSIKLEITATGVPGIDEYGSVPAELLVSAESVGWNGFGWMQPTLFGPYGDSPTADSETVGFVWVAIYPAPITSGQAYITLDTPSASRDASVPAVIEVTSATITADFYPRLFGCGVDINCDGFIGLTELDVVLTNWNQAVGAFDGLTGEFTGDGFVGLDDLDMVLNSWNAGIPPAAVPEPATLIYLGIGVAAILRRQWR